MRHYVAWEAAALLCQFASLAAGMPAVVGVPSVAPSTIPTEEGLPDWVKKASWTVVHVKKKRSVMLNSFLSLDASDSGDPSIKDQIRQMGKDLCKTRPDDPKCKQFQDKEKEEAQEEEQQEATEETTVKPTPEPTQVPATADVTEAPADVTKAPASVKATQAPEPEERVETTGRAPALPSQGFEGKKVRYVDGKTMTRDWHDEYEISSTPRFRMIYSGAQTHFVKIPFALLAMVYVLAQMF